jgi:hypothetical protein
MRLNTIKTRLETIAGSVIGDVIHALGRGTAKRYPAAYILQTGESGEPDDLLGAHSQRITARFVVEYMVKHAGNADTGGPAADELETVRDAAHDALIGWSPYPDHSEINFLSGQLVAFDAGMTIWRDTFSTTYFKDSRP